MQQSRFTASDTNHYLQESFRCIQRGHHLYRKYKDYVYRKMLVQEYIEKKEKEYWRR